MSTAPRLPRLAIVSAGITSLESAILFYSLSKHAHLNVHLYEESPELNERPLPSTFSHKDQQCMNEMTPDLVRILKETGATRPKPPQQRIGAGKHFGELIVEIEDSEENSTLVATRVDFFSALLKDLPVEFIHTGKKLKQIVEERDNSLTLVFEDGGYASADAIIGADGPYGYTRPHVLGTDHPALMPVSSGFWECRTEVSFEKAKAAIGEKWLAQPTQVAWVGENGFLWHCDFDEGKKVQCSLAHMCSEWDGNRETPLPHKAVEAIFAWNNSPIAKSMVKLFGDEKDLKAVWHLHHGIETPTFCKGAVVLTGDSAHKVSPWQGQSWAAQFVEDAVLLDALLKNVKTAAELPIAFQAYDAVRRPRTQRIIKDSAATGKIMCGSEGLDPTRLKELLKHRWDFIMSLDVKASVEDALRRFEEGRESGDAEPRGGGLGGMASGPDAMVA